MSARPRQKSPVERVTPSNNGNAKAPSAPKTAGAPKRQKVAATAATAPKPVDQPQVGPSTKQERMLTLLSRPEGASIEEMMQATNWQQHSVRGFLAGTVKKKLGFALSSAKTADDVRRYHIKAPRPLI
jgi:hypothetical protein